MPGYEENITRHTKRQNKQTKTPQTKQNKTPHSLNRERASITTRFLYVRDVGIPKPEKLRLLRQTKMGRIYWQ